MKFVVGRLCESAKLLINSPLRRSGLQRRCASKELPEVPITFGAILIATLVVQMLLHWWLKDHGFSCPESWELAPAFAEWPIRFLRDWSAGIWVALRRVLVPDLFSMDLAVTPAAWYVTLGGWIVAASVVLLIWAQAPRRPVFAFGLTWLPAAATAAATCVFWHSHGAILEQQLYTLGIGLALIVGLAIEQACRFEARSTRYWIEVGWLTVGALALLGWSNLHASDWASEPRMLRATLRHQPSSGLAHTLHQLDHVLDLFHGLQPWQQPFGAVEHDAKDRMFRNQRFCNPYHGSRHCTPWRNRNRPHATNAASLRGTSRQDRNNCDQVKRTSSASSMSAATQRRTNL